MSSYKQKYQQYLTGQYALVDYYYRNIWFVVDNEADAVAIKKAFVAKVSFVVVDLTTFSNFNLAENTVDSDVCFSWQVPIPVNPKSTSYSLVMNYNNIQTSSFFISDQLINQPVTTMLDVDKQVEVQDQMFLYKKILDDFAGSFNKSAKEQSKRTLDFYNSNLSKFMSAVELIFLTELTIADIENQLYHLSLEHLGTNGTLPILLLNILNRSIYE
jgi:hypothetical protein